MNTPFEENIIEKKYNFNDLSQKSWFITAVMNKNYNDLVSIVYTNISCNKQIVALKIEYKNNDDLLAEKISAEIDEIYERCMNE